MIKKIILLLLFVVFTSTTSYLTVVVYADENPTGEAITIDDIREKRGVNLPTSNNDIENATLIKKVKSVISNQTIQFLINIVVIVAIILLLIFLKRRRKDLKGNGGGEDRIQVKIKGEIDYRKPQPIEKPAILEYIEKLLFPFFRRDIAKINSHLSVLSTKFDELQQINQEQHQYSKEQHQITYEQTQRSNELISHYHSILLNELKLKTDKILTTTESDKLLPYRLFALGKSLQITKEINCSYEDFVKSAELSLSIEREFNLFNQIPLEYLAKKNTDKNIVAIGNWANLLIKHLGYGLSFKHSLLDSIEVSNDGEKIIPLPLIPNNIAKIESLIITNQWLSSLILYSDNILERAKDNISESIIMPIEIVVPQFEFEFIKFGGIERNHLGIYRWALGFEDISGVKIYNNSHRPSKIEVRFSVVSATSGSYIIVNNERVLIENNVEIVRTIELATGENFMSFDFEGNKVKVGADPRELKFAIYNLSFNGNTVMSDITVATEDYNVRKRLHSVGFFEVEAEIVTNKGFYIEKLPVSKFTHNPPHFFNMKSPNNILRYFTKLFQTYNISIIYKGYRKERLDEK